MAEAIYKIMSKLCKCSYKISSEKSLLTLNLGEAVFLDFLCLCFALANLVTLTLKCRLVFLHILAKRHLPPILTKEVKTLKTT